MRKVVTLVSLVVVVCASATVTEAQAVSSPRQTNVYTYLAPLTLILIASELIYLGVTRKKLVSFQEAIANLGTALGNQTMNVLIAASVYLIYGYLWEHFRFIRSASMFTPSSSC